MIKHMCVSREAGFCTANDYAIAIWQTIITLIDRQRPKIKELYMYCYTYIPQPKNILEVSGL